MLLTMKQDEQITGSALPNSYEFLALFYFCCELLLMSLNVTVQIETDSEG